MKGIAISQIILIVLGVMVLGVIGYLLYTQFVGGKGQLTFEQCRSIAMAQCTGPCEIKGEASCSVTYFGDADAANCQQWLGGTAEGKVLKDISCDKIFPKPPTK